MKMVLPMRLSVLDPLFQDLLGLLDESKDAYSSGDGAAAKQLSEEGKAHGRKMDEYNRQVLDPLFQDLLGLLDELTV
jgi:hypothetical protein